jgi:peptidoglycan/xylan/chitin deacetylase (PgdA/CDA1 family)
VQLAILMYHSLDESGSRVSLTPRQFARQLERLHDAAYTVLPLGEALTELWSAGDASKSLSRRLAALTFDDGYASVHQVAAPLLDRLGWRATIFAVSEYLGSNNRWPGQAEFVPSAQLLSWQQLGDLSRAGWEIGAHTRTHPDLTRLESPRLEDEIAGGKRQLEDRLGRCVELFAYPSGLYDERVRAIARRHFRAACTTDMGWASARSAPDALERIEMWDFGRPGAHHLLGSPLMRPYVALCRAARSRRRH